MTLSPAETIARPRSRIPNWNLDPYELPGPVKEWTVAGRQALYFNATTPTGSPEWTLVGINPPELEVVRDHSFRMYALPVRGKTVVIVIQGPSAEFAQFLPTATRLVAITRVPARPVPVIWNDGFAVLESLVERMR